MQKKIKLEVDFENESNLFGICSHIKNYRLVWQINKQLGFKFSKVEDFKFKIKKHKKAFFYACYYYKDISNLSTYYLLSNVSTSDNNNLLSQYKQVDFLFYCEIPTQCKDIKKLLNEIKKIPNVLTAFEIEQNILENQKNIISELEIHITNIEKIEKEKKKKYNIIKNYDK